jgi:hypothetical protein
MNVKFSYLYRDGANYKQYGEVVFANPCQLNVEVVSNIINSQLIDGCWFVASDWGLPELFFKEFSWDDEIDHTWHEFEDIVESNTCETDNRTIDDFLKCVLKHK